MGAWGPGILSDDLAADIKADFTDLIGQGLSPTEATARLLADYGPDVLEDMDEGPVFWLALAATQWKLGRLEEFVKEKALHMIESGENLRKWEEEAGPKEAKRRAAALAKLKEQLLSPAPPPKKVKPRDRQETDMEVGEVWRYRLSSGRAILLLVVGHHSDKGGRFPILAILDADPDRSPDRADLERASIRRPLKAWNSSRFGVGRWSKTDHPRERLERLLSGLPIPPPATYEDGSWSYNWWKHLDEFLAKEFGLGSCLGLH